MTNARPLRSHQRQLAGVVATIASGEMDVRDNLAAVTPGGGKSLLPVIAAATLMRAGLVDRLVWLVPRDSLRLQAKEAFADPAWRATLGHALSVRAADNAPDPSRGLAGYVTTYQGVAAAPGLHLAEFRRHRRVQAPKRRSVMFCGVPLRVWQPSVTFTGGDMVMRGGRERDVLRGERDVYRIRSLSLTVRNQQRPRVIP